MEIKARLKTVTDVTRLVNAAIKHSCDITASRGRYVVSAASLLGLWSLDLSNEITLRCDEDFSTDFLEAVADLVVRG